MVLGLGLEHSCPWPRERLTLASDFFCVLGLGLEPCVLDSTSDEKFILCEVERGTGAREIHPSLDEMNKVRSKKSKGFSGRNRKFRRFFRPKTGDLKKKKKKKKRSSSQKRHKIWCQSTKITNLDLDLRSPDNVFGAQSSPGGGTVFVWGGTSTQLGGHGPGMSPRGAGSVYRVRQAARTECIELGHIL